MGKPPDLDLEAAAERLCEAFAKNVLAGYAASAEQYAKENATWQDHTGDARRGIQGEAYYRPGEEMGITLAHTVEYGIYLETAHDGNYAILKPTLDHYLPEIRASARKYFEGG
jgi:hypothetical protein